MSSNRFRLALATLIATWVLLLIGGTVNPMGASMACPDWYFVPTCNGELLPEMKGGVLYEHGHRLWASWVGVLTVALGISTLLGPRLDPGTRKLGILAIVLVCLQGALGGITVKLNISKAISTLHLGTAMVFFCLLVLLCFRLAPVKAEPGGEHARRGLLAVAILAVFVQILLGGLVRHLGAGLICGDDWIGCGPAGWTRQPLAHLHMTHRVVAFALVPLILLAAGQAQREARRLGRPFALTLARLPVVLLLAQVALGLTTVATGRSVAIVTFHTGVGALVLASLWACFLALGRERTASAVPGGAP